MQYVDPVKNEIVQQVEHAVVNNWLDVCAMFAPLQEERHDFIDKVLAKLEALCFDLCWNVAAPHAVLVRQNGVTTINLFSDVDRLRLVALVHTFYL